MSWPNNNWYALNNTVIDVGNEKYELSTIDCGVLKLPSGKLVSADPFAGLSKEGNVYVKVPAGEYKVIVTLADVSSENNGSHIREAYATIVIDGSKKEVKRSCIQPTLNCQPNDEKIKEGEYFGFGVDAGTACFVDAESLMEGMPDEDEWSLVPTLLRVNAYGATR